MTSRHILSRLFHFTLLLLVGGSALAQQGGDTIGSITGTRPHSPAKAVRHPKPSVRPAAPRRRVVARPAVHVAPRRVAARPSRRLNRGGGKPVRFAAHSNTPVIAAQALPIYTNPVIDHEFGDPSILNDRGVYYAYATNNRDGNLPCARSSDLIHWTDLSDAMPTLPSWARPGSTWAPFVRTIIAGRRYIAYFNAWDRADGLLAVGVAVSTSPSGPFVPVADTPLLVQKDLGGCIDPSCFQDDDGSLYLVWKNDGNSRGQDTWLWVQKLSTDGLRQIGTATRLIKQDQAWEGSLIQAPTLWKHGATYYLFYSANYEGSCSYAIGYATAPSVLGPFTKPQNGPWLATTGRVCGPGDEHIVKANDGRAWMAYNAWQKGPGSYRSMNVDPLVWSGDVPYLLGPSR